MSSILLGTGPSLDSSHAVFYGVRADDPRSGFGRRAVGQVARPAALGNGFTHQSSAQYEAWRQMCLCAASYSTW